MFDGFVIVFHKAKPKNNRPLKLKRMNWMEHPLLDIRQSPTPPKVQPLPPVEAIDFEEPDFSTSNDAILFDDPDALVDPDMRRVSPRKSRNYPASGKIWEKRGME